MTPVPAHVRGSDPAQILFARIRWFLECKKIKDPRENLGWEEGYRSEGVTTRKQRAEELPGGLYLLIYRGNGREARIGVMSDDSEMIESGFDAGEHIGEHCGRLYVTGLGNQFSEKQNKYRGIHAPFVRRRGTDSGVAVCRWRGG